MSETPDRSDTARLAERLLVALLRLRARAGVESEVPSITLPTSQLAVLRRILSDGERTAAQLAAAEQAEHIGQQATARSRLSLKPSGLARTTSDTNNERLSLVNVTYAGRCTVDSLDASSEAWLIRAIDATVSSEERAALDAAIELLEQISDADLSSEVDIAARFPPATDGGRTAT